MGFWGTAFCRAIKSSFFTILQSQVAVVILVLTAIISAITILVREGCGEIRSKLSKWFWSNCFPALTTGALLFLWYFFKMPSTIIQETIRNDTEKLSKLESIYKVDIGTYTKANKDLKDENILLKSKAGFDKNKISVFVGTTQVTDECLLRLGEGDEPIKVFMTNQSGDDLEKIELNFTIKGIKHIFHPSGNVDIPYTTDQVKVGEWGIDECHQGKYKGTLKLRMKRHHEIPWKLNVVCR